MAADPKLVHALTTNQVERAILKTILFWYPKAKTSRDGHVWLIKTAKEFQDHGVHAAEKTIWNRMCELRKRGLVETIRHRHPYDRSLIGPVTWIRPTETFIAAVTPVPAGKSLLPAQGSTDCPEQEVGSSLNGKYLYTEDNTEKVSSDTSSADDDSGKKKTMAKAPGEGFQKIKLKADSAKAKGALGIAEAAQGLKPKVLGETKLPNAKALFEVFGLEYKSVWGVYPGGESIARLSMMKKALERFRESGLDDKAIRVLVARAAKDWSLFADWCKNTLNMNVKAQRANHADLTRLAYELADWSKSGFQTGTGPSQEVSGSGISTGTPNTQNAPQGTSGWLSGDF